MAMHAFIPVASTLAHVEAAEALGMDARDARIRIAESSRQGRLPIDLHVAVLMDVVERTGHRELPAQVAVERPNNKFGVFGFLAITQPDVGAGLEAASRQLATWMQAVRYPTEDDEDGALEVRVEVDDSVARVGSLPWCLLAEIGLASLVGAGRMLSGQAHWLPERLSASDPASVRVLEQVFGAGVVRGDPAMRVGAEGRRVECSHHHPAMAAYFEATLQASSEARERADVLVRQVRQAIASGLPRGKGALESVAPELGMSARTLQRHLESQGESFALLREDVRRALALRLLGEPLANVASVAATLGYDDESSFRRAFHRWTGLAPSEWRARVLGDGTDQ
ncbi:MAG: helix-turn-helix domain-containing protein [Alphaproteobacteria bacterium]|nr:helix-turn-helix domain-containing protein [Alphaproteobacteria bacterium]